MWSTKNLAVLVFACLVKEAFYVYAAPSVSTNELDLNGRSTVENRNRVLEIENGNEIDDPQSSPTFESLIQGINNIDSAMEAMIDNYTDGVEHVSSENGLDKDQSFFEKFQRGDGHRSRAAETASDPAVDITK